MYRAVHVTKSEANKKFFAYDSANYSFYLLCIMASFLMEKVFFIFQLHFLPSQKMFRLILSTSISKAYLCF